MRNIIIFLFLLCFTAQANDTQNILHHKGFKENIALIIGNSNYENLPSLKHPLQNARAMRAILQERGFKIFYKENASIKDMKKLLRKFTHKIHNAGVSVYYFTGNSANVDGKNYMLGTEASLDNKTYINHEGIPLNIIIKKMNNARNNLNILVSDTCRNIAKVNPFDNNHFGRGVGRGLLSLANTRDIFIAYSTTSQSSNGVLTHYFIKNLSNKSLSIKDIFTKTRKEVNIKQNIDNFSKINKDFFFILPKDKRNKR
jgi:hypothetical protein